MKAPTSRGPEKVSAPGIAMSGVRPDRDEQRVVVQRVAAHGANAARLGVDRREPVGPQVCAVVGRDADEIEAPRGGAPEGLRDRALALDEVGVGLEQLDVGAVDPRWPWRAISASRPAMPPPAMTIVGMSIEARHVHSARHP